MERVVSKLEIISLNLPKWLNKPMSKHVSFLAAIQVGHLSYASQKNENPEPTLPRH